jgi:hypothetical protein
MARRRNPDAPPSAQVLSGDRLGILGDLRRRALCYDPSAVRAGTGTEIHHVIGLADRILVMLDDDDGIAEIAQIDQRVEQPLVVALMQPDGGLVQNVHDAHQARADLARETDTLGLAARQRVGAAIECEVAQAHIREEAQPVADLLDDLDRDFAAPAGKLQRVEELDRFRDRERRDLGQAGVRDEDVACGPVEPGASTVGARTRRAVFREFLAHGGRFRLPIAALEILDDAFEGVFALERAALAIQVLEFDLLIVASEEDEILDSLRKALIGRFDVELRVPGE